MKQRTAGRALSSEKISRDIKRKMRKQYSAEEKIRIVLDGLRGEDNIAVNGKPLEDVTLLQDVCVVIKGGRVVKALELP